MALSRPATPEADVSKADTAPDEEVGQTGESEEPGKDRLTAGGFGDEGEETECELDDGTPEWSATFIDVGEEFRTHSLYSCQ